MQVVFTDTDPFESDEAFGGAPVSLLHIIPSRRQEKSRKLVHVHASSAGTEPSGYACECI